jgi:hypothetical protein
MNDQTGKDWVVLVAFLFDRASAEKQNQMLQVLYDGIEEPERELTADGRQE